MLKNNSITFLDMNWIDSFDFFLFDLDGLLVDTDRLHFKACLELCYQWGLELDWSWPHYSNLIHMDLKGEQLREAMYKECPGLYQREPNWANVHAKKREIYQELLIKEEVQLLPGVSELLAALEKGDKKRCVVTNSYQLKVNLIREKIPLLNTISTWFTRESYENPKPYPDGYQKALKWGKEFGNRAIGFEDSLKGLKSMEEAGIPTKFLICNHPSPPTHFKIKDGVYHCSSFLDVPQALKDRPCNESL